MIRRAGARTLYEYGTTRTVLLTRLLRKFSITDKFKPHEAYVLVLQDYYYYCTLYRRTSTSTRMSYIE